MAARMQAVYYRAPDGAEPVNEFIEDLPPAHQVAVDNQIDRINELTTPSTPNLPFPHSSQVEGELRELRCHYGNIHYRILHRRSRNLVILLHCFIKRTPRIPQREIDIANARWEDYKERMGARPRRRPRAAGRDAPPRTRREPGG
jgi:phage-related protein